MLQRRGEIWRRLQIVHQLRADSQASGAVTAAYRLRRLVSVPGSRMSFSLLRRLACFSFGLHSLASVVALWPTATLAEPAPGAIAVNVDQAKLVKLPDRVATIVVGNPLIADVTLQNGGVLIVTGKGYGATNFIAMDRSGQILVDRQIQVAGPTDQLVTVYRGVSRETYSCMPICQRRVTLGDGEAYFKSVMDQASSLSGQASSSASAGSKTN